MAASGGACLDSAVRPAAALGGVRRRREEALWALLSVCTWNWEELAQQRKAGGVPKGPHLWLSPSPAVLPESREMFWGNVF